MKQNLQERIEVSLLLDNIYREGDIREIYQFDQTWSSTSLGFPGPGGDAMTQALTTVVLRTNNLVDVYFRTRKAYTKKMSLALMDDIRKFNLASINESGKYD